MEKFFKSLSAIFAGIPGITILMSSLGVPDPDDKVLFGGIIEALGCGALGLIYLNRKYFLNQNLKKISKWIMISLTFFFASIILYIIIYKICIKQYEDFSRVYFPLFPSEALSDAINTAGGKMEFVEKWMGDGATRQIEKLSASQMIQTSIIFLIVYQFIFTTLTVSFGLLGIREEKLK